MTEPNEKPRIEEQYAVALSNGAQSRVVLAAGMQRDRVGVLLLRLRAEYDAVRGEMERAGKIAPDRALERKVLQGNLAVAAHAADHEAAEVLQNALQRLERRTEAEIKAARAVILVALTTLPEARQELGALAIRMAANPKRGLDAPVALRLAGRVLDVWLDETCHRCDGTGVIGSRYQGDTERQCSTCKGTGHRRDILGDSRAETHFAADLMAEVQRQVAAAAAGIRAALFNDEAPDRPMHPELARRLAELRGVEAQTD